MYFSPLASRWKTVSRSLIARLLEAMEEQNKIDIYHFSFLFFFLLCRSWTERTADFISSILMDSSYFFWPFFLYLCFFVFLFHYIAFPLNTEFFCRFLFLFIRIISIRFSHLLFKSIQEITIPYLPTFTQTTSTLKIGNFVVHYWIAAVCP